MAASTREIPADWGPAGGTQGIPRNDPEFEAAYEQERRALLITDGRFFAKSALILYSAFWALDWAVAREHIWHFLAIRLGVAFLLFLAYRLSFVTGARRWFPLALNGSIVSSALGVSTMATVMHVTVGSQYFMGNVLLMFGAGLAIPWRLRDALIVSGAMVAPHLFLVGFTHGVGEAVFPFASLGGSMTVVCLSAWLGDRGRRRDLALRLQLKKANERLHELDEAKTRFFANVSHELRTPLMLIRLTFDILRKQLGAETYPEIDTGIRNSTRLLLLIQDLLNVQRLDMGQLQLNKRPVDLAMLVHQVSANFQSQAVQRRIVLTLPETRCVAEVDPDQMGTVLFNLLSNAVKFTDPKDGRIEISVRNDGADVHIEVSDNGIGIPASTLPDIFDRFVQADPSSRRAHEGVGIGLALVRELVSLHGGRVHADSQEGVGSKFSVLLPIGDVSAVEVAEHAQLKLAAQSLYADGATEARPRLSAVATTKSGDEPRPRVLIAEDNADLLYHLSAILAEHYDVVQAADGLEAWMRITESPPELILLDLMMPKISGEEVLARLRADPQLARIPVIILTADAGGETHVAMLAAGADDYLAKPFNPRELIARADNLLRARRNERDLLCLKETLEARVAEQTAELRALGANLESLQEAERKHIARELHDEFGQILAVLRMELANLDAAARGTTTISVGDVRDGVERLGKQADRLRQTARWVLGALRPPALDDQGLAAALEALIDDLASRCGTQFVTVIEIGTEPLDERVSLAAYRIVQEALNNVVRHARARIVTLEVLRLEGVLSVKIVDDGVGFSPGVTAGLGTLGIRERARMLNGTCEIASTPNGGTQVCVALPMVEPTFEKEAVA